MNKGLEKSNDFSILEPLTTFQCDPKVVTTTFPVLREWALMVNK